MFDFDDTRRICLNDLLKNDHRLITEKKYYAAIQRQFHIQMPGDPEPKLSEDDERDLQLIHDYERQHPGLQPAITGFQIVIVRE